VIGPKTYSLMAAGLLTTVALSGCGGSADASHPNTSSTSASSPRSSADPSLAPVTVGFRNLEGAAYSLPDLRVGFDAALEYVNAEAGGINGHPLKAVECKTDVTPETSVACANKFVSKKVVMATQGVDYAADAGLPILKEAGILDSSAFAYGPASNTAVGDVIVSESSNQEGYAASLVQLSNMGAKKVAVVLADVPPSHTAMQDVVVPSGKRLGVDVSPYFYTSPADWTSLGATVLAGKPDAIVYFATDADCIAAEPAFRSLGFKGIIQAGICSVLASKFSPGELKDVVVANPFYNATMTPIPEGVQSDLDIFAKYTAGKGIKNVGQAMQGFFMGTWIADVLSQVKGEVTAQSVKATAATAKGKLFFRDTGYDCSAPTWPGTTACGGGYLFTEVNSDGKNEVMPHQPADISPIRPTS